MKAQGTLEPPRGQRSPLGQKTSGFVLTCFLIQSAEQGKQNLWWGAVGHCTKCVSSRRCAQIVHFSSGLFGIASASERLFMLDLFFLLLWWWEKVWKRKCYTGKAWRCSWLQLSTWGWHFESVFPNLAGRGHLAAGGSSHQPWVWGGSHICNFWRQRTTCTLRR